MTRAKTVPAGRRRRKKVMKLARGYWGGRSKRYRRAQETVMRAMAFSYRDRRTRKRDFRKLWITRVGAASVQEGMSYSRFMSALKKAAISLNRKVLAEIAVHHPEIFGLIVRKVKA